MTWLLASLRRLRADRGTALGLALLIGVSAFAAAAAPRVLAVVADDALRGELARASAGQRALAFGEEGQYGTQLAAVEARGLELVRALPPILRERLGEPLSSTESARWVADSAVQTPATIRFRFQPGALERLRFEAGRAPTDATTRSTTTRIGSQEEVTVVHFEGAISTASAEQLGLALGDEIELSADPADRLGRIGQGDVVAMTVVGIFVVTDPDDPFWFDDRALIAPTVRDVNANLAYLDATALLADAAYPAFMARPTATTPLRYVWRTPALVDAFDAGSAAAVTTALRRVETQYPTVATTFGDTTSSSGLRVLLDRQAARWGVAQAILAVLGVGAAAVALAAVGLVARMLASRRRAGLTLSMHRGATRRQLLRSALAEGAILAAPTGLIGLAVAWLLLPGAGVRTSALAVAAVAAAAVVILAGAMLGAVTGGRAGADPSDVPGADTSRRRRLILEGFVVVLAAMGVVLLRSRGLSGGAETIGTATEAPTVDPLIAAVPALVGLAAGIVTLRTFRIPLRVLDALAGAGRGLASALAVRRLTRGSGAGPVLLVLLGTATIATFSTALFAHVDRAAEAISWNDVGAAFRVSGSVGRLPERFDPAVLPGVTASAGAFRGSVPIGDKGAQVELLALDVADYAAVVAGTPAETSSAARFAERNPAVAPTITDPSALPVLITTALTIGVDGLAVGDPVAVSIEGVRVRGQVQAIVEALPTIPVGARGALIPRDGWPLDTDPPSTTTVFLRAPRDAGPAIVAAVAEAVPGARLVDQAAAEAAIARAPVAQAVRAGGAAALAVAAAYAALAVAVALALTGAARAVEAAHLRLLGLGPRDAVLLVLLEYGPLIGLAFVIGVGLGLGLFLLVRPALGLDVIVGSALAVPIAISPVDALLTLAAIIVVAGIGIGIGALAERRAMTSGAIRLGIERP